MLYPEYVYGKYLLFGVEEFEYYYPRIYDLKSNCFVLTLGKGSYATCFCNGSDVYVNTYNDTHTGNKYYKVKLKDELNYAKISKKEYDSAILTCT